MECRTTLPVDANADQWRTCKLPGDNPGARNRQARANMRYGCAGLVPGQTLEEQWLGARVVVGLFLANAADGTGITVRGLDTYKIKAQNNKESNRCSL